jgi:hypothetical protein
MNEIGLNLNTRIQVSSCENFSVVKGETNSKEILNLNDILEKFYTKYTSLERKVKNIIDLIEYGKEIKNLSKQTFTYSNSKNCRMVIKDEDDHYFSRSYFPYGFSLNQNRSLYYYFKNIVYNIPTSYPFTKIKFLITIDEEKIDFEIEDDYLNNEDNCLKSSILDSFDFNYKKLELDLKGFDLSTELFETEIEIDVIKKPNPNFIFI